MAYFNYLYSVPVARVEAFRLDQNQSLQATRIIRISHLVAYWVPVQPLGGLLGEAIDGGEILHSSLWHPLRAPTIHNRASVTELLPKLEAAWTTASANIENPEEDWYGEQILKIIDLFQWAQQRDEAIVSCLVPPADPERANRVTIPKVT